MGTRRDANGLGAVQKSTNPMSALGQNRAFRNVQSMSALPPKADIAGRQLDVRFVPVPDMPTIKHRAQLRKHPELLLAPDPFKWAAWRPSYIAARLQGTMFRDLSLIMRRYLTKEFTRQ
jgi:hypothetical protein